MDRSSMRKLFSVIISLVLVALAIGGFLVYRNISKPVERHFCLNCLGWAPSDLGLAIAPDGKTAYIPFSLDDALLMVDLSTFTVTDSINVSAAGNMLQSQSAVLTPDGKKLYVSNYGTKNVMVVNTENKRVEKVLPIKPLHAVAIAMSRDGSKTYLPSEDGGLCIINTSDNSYRRISVPGVTFGPVALSSSNPDLLYTVGILESSPGTSQPYFFAFNVSSNTIVRSTGLENEVLPLHTFARRLVVNSNETAAYFGWMQMTGQGGERGVGDFIVFDPNTFQVSASAPMQNGVTDFAVDENTGKAYIIGFWAAGGAPQKLPILEYDISTNNVVHEIPVSPSTDQRAIALDPTDANYLYMTEGDFNLIRKVEISTGKEVSIVQFHPEADIRPYAIICGDNNTGYTVSRYSRRAYRLDLESGQLMGSIELPLMHAGWGFHQGKLYVGAGSEIYALNPSDGSTLEIYHIGTQMGPGIFTFYGDRMATLDYETGMIAKRLLIFDARTMTLLRSIELPREPYGDKVIVSPDGSKLYVPHGSTQGTAFVTVLNASTLEITNTIEIPFIGLTRRGMTGFVEADFDEANRILYLTGFESVYKINMDTDNLISILDLIDIYGMQNINGWTPTGLCGVVLSSSKDKLFIIAGDSHSMYTYNLVNSSWSKRITNLKGYFITDAVSSPDRRYLYTVNGQSDSITMVDLTSGDIVRVIGL